MPNRSDAALDAPPQRWGGSLLLFLVGYGLLQLALYAALSAGYERIRFSAHGKLNRARGGELTDQVIIAGSSRALVHYSPPLLESRWNAPVYNYGFNAADAVEQLATLEVLLSHNQPRFIILNLDTAGFDPEAMQFHSKLLSALYFREASIRRLLVSNSLFNWKYYLSPASVFPMVPSLLTLAGRRGQDGWVQGADLKELGWDHSFDDWKASHPQGKTYDFAPERWAAFERIAQIMSGPNAPPCAWVLSPELRDWQRLALNHAAIVERMHALAESHGIPFYDFAGPSCGLCESRENFYNSQHLNRHGAEQFSGEVAQALAQQVAASARRE